MDLNIIDASHCKTGDPRNRKMDSYTFSQFHLSICYTNKYWEKVHNWWLDKKTTYTVSKTCAVHSPLGKVAYFSYLIGTVKNTVLVQMVNCTNNTALRHMFSYQCTGLDTLDTL